MDKNKTYISCGKCGSNMDSDLICPGCGKDHTGAADAPIGIIDYFKKKIEKKLIRWVIGTVVVFCLIMGMGLAGWLDAIFIPVQTFIGNTFGEGAAIRVAYETDDYFRTHGEKIDHLIEDIERVAIKTNEINEYRIKITDSLIDRNYGLVTNPRAFYIEQKITFEHHPDVIKVQVTSGTLQQGDKAAYYDKLFAEYRLLPFGTYFIVTIDGEKYILMNRGQGDGNYMPRKSAVKAADSPALYDRLMSYSIERIIDYAPFKGSDITCFEVSNVREYSIPVSGMPNWANIFLREYNSKPGAYLMKYENEPENMRREIKAEFYYSRVNSKVPKLNDYQ